MSDPTCPDCGAEMQYLECKWRCPWASTERWKEAQKYGPPVVLCEWPLTTPRQIVGLPDDVVNIR